MKISIIEPLGITEEEAEKLQAEYAPGCELVYHNAKPADAAEKAARAKGADIVMLANTPLPASVLDAAPSVKFLSVAFTGVDHVAMDACHEKGITVSNCSGYANEAVSELAIGMAIALYRKLAACDAAVRGGKDRTGLLGLELSGKTFGVIGAGAIGQKTMALAKAFGCHVLAYSRHKKDIPGVTFVTMDELLAASDIISLHVPLTDATRGLIGAEELGRMKTSAILINTARGPVVDSAALADALDEGRLAGAAVDVFEHEPPIEASHALLHAKNILLAPHIGFATKEALQKRAVIAFQNIAAYLKGTPQNVM